MSEPKPDDLCGDTDKTLNISCYLKAGHAGPHQGYVEQHDDVVFWRSVDWASWVCSKCAWTVPPHLRDQASCESAIRAHLAVTHGIFAAHTSVASERSAFEQWITAPPYEKALTRYAADHSWSGQYRDYAVQLAWEAWLKRAGQEEHR